MIESCYCNFFLQLEHEEWWKDFKYYHERLKVIYADWARHKMELINKAQIVFAEAAVAYELEEVRNEYHQNQKQLCDVLYEKVGNSLLIFYPN